MDVDRAVFRLLPQMQGGSTSTVPPGFLLQRAYDIPAADSCSPPPALLTTGLPSVKCASSIASAHPAAIAISCSASESGRGA